MTRETLIEVMATVLLNAGAVSLRRSADLQLSALEAAGVRVVPVEKLRPVVGRLALSSHPHCRDAYLALLELFGPDATPLSASPFSPPAKDTGREGGE